MCEKERRALIDYAKNYHQELWTCQQVLPPVPRTPNRAFAHPCDFNNVENAVDR